MAGAATILCCFASPCRYSRALLLHSPAPSRPGPLRERRRRPRREIVAAASTVAPVRRSGNYQPTPWTYDFVQSLDTDIETEMENRREILKVEVGRLFGLKARSGQLMSLLELVAAVQQLGLGHLFVGEVKESLDMLSARRDEVLLLHGDLHSTALLFRVLRENGHEISQDVFYKFATEGGGGVQPGTATELLSSYEASFYAFEGDDLLEELRVFTTEGLRKLARESGVPHTTREKAAHALDMPIHFSIRSLQARWFMDAYSTEENMEPAALALARLEFLLLQKSSRKELKEAYRLWNDMGVVENLPFARNRLAESYLWAAGILPAPQHGHFRICMSHLICFITVIDDVYDVYGTMDELEIFTEAIERWDVKAIEPLPKYMKILFMAFFNFINSTTFHILKEKGIDVTMYLKKEVVNFIKAYMLEAKWYNNNYIPTFEEYLTNAAKSITVPLILTYTFLMVSEDITEETLKSFYNFSSFITLAAVIGRLYDDVGTSTDELERGDVHKAIECYMHNEKISNAVAREQVRNKILLSWKKLNKERFASGPAFPTILADAAVNLSGTFHSFYNNGDGFGKPDKKTMEQIMSLVVDTI